MTQHALWDLEDPTAHGWPETPHVLASYAYAQRIPLPDFLEVGRTCDLIVDSGAFTAESSGKPVDHDAYLTYLSERAEVIRFAFTLDVIGNHQATWDNYMYSRDALKDTVKLVPTWHMGSPISELHALCETTDYVAIGGAVPFASAPDVLFRGLTQVHNIAQQHHTKLHGLGITNNRAMHQLPWASVDSSSWNTFGRFDSFPLADRQGRIGPVTYGQGPVPPEHVDLVRHYGLDPTRMTERGYGLSKWADSKDHHATVRSSHRAASARSFMYAEVIKNQTDPDFRIYLATQLDIAAEFRTIRRAHQLGNPWAPTHQKEQAHT